VILSAVVETSRSRSESVERYSHGDILVECATQSSAFRWMLCPCRVVPFACPTCTRRVSETRARLRVLLSLCTRRRVVVGTSRWLDPLHTTDSPYHPPPRNNPVPISRNAHPRSCTVRYVTSRLLLPIATTRGRRARVPLQGSSQLSGSVLPSLLPLEFRGSIRFLRDVATIDPNRNLNAKRNEPRDKRRESVILGRVIVNSRLVSWRMNERERCPLMPRLRPRRRMQQALVISETT